MVKVSNSIGSRQEVLSMRKIPSLLIALFLISCGNPEVNLPTVTGTNTGGSTCGESVVDYGQKGPVAASQRGIYADVQMIPGTARPAIAHSDLGVIGVKVTYHDGSNYVSEVVSAGTATFIKIVFLSSGRPAVFWTTGGTQSVLGAFRSAPFGTAGNWTVGVLDSAVTTSRSLNVSVSPLDEIAIVYIASAATATARPRFLYCEAGCSGPGSFQGMITTENIEAVSLSNNHMSAGIAWCKVSSTDYYPAVTYSVAAAGAAAGTRYAVCRQSNLANCLTAANWTKQTVNTTGALVASNLYLDPTVTDDVPKVIVNIATGIQVNIMSASTACSAAPAAFTAVTTLGAATTGNAWLKLLKDSDGYFHVVGNLATTNVRYFNSQSTTFTGAWNTVGNVETTTLSAVTATSGGADLSSSDSKLHVSYGGNSAPFSTHLATLSGYSTASSSATFTVQQPDTTGNVLLTAAPIRNVKTAFTSGGRSAIAYVDHSPGTITAGRLKYAIRSDNSATGSWSYVQIPGPTNPQFPALAFDGNDKPWISFFDQTINRFYLATNSSSEGTGTWSIYTMPIVPSGTYALPAVNDTAVAMYKSGSSYYPVILVLDSTNANTTPGLKSAMFNPSTGTWSNVNDSSPIFSLGASDGNSLTADFDLNGNIVAAFWDITTTRLKYFHSSNGGSTWTTGLNITATLTGEFASIRLNRYNGYPAVSYFDRTNNRSYYSVCASSPASCASGGWADTLLEANLGISGLTMSTGQVLGTGTAFSSTGNPSVFYSTGQAGLGSLRKCELSGSNFLCSTVSEGRGGNTVGAAAVNYAISGWSVDAKAHDSGGTTAAYIGPGGWLYQYSCK